MSGIGQRNKREILLQPVNVSATVPPHAPTSAAVVARCVAPVPGRVKGIAVCIAVAGTAGNSTDFKQVVRCRDANAPGSGTTVVTSDAVLMDLNLTPDDLPAAGTIRRGMRLSTAADLAQGDIIDIHYSESGTIGTATRATFNIVGVIFEASGHLDPLM